MAKPATITDQKFAEAVLQADGLVMVDFWATYCAACRLVVPVVDEIANDNHGKVVVMKLNVDENPDYATQYQIRSTLTVIFFRNGREVDRIVGAGKKHHSTARLEALLG